VQETPSVFGNTLRNSRPGGNATGFIAYEFSLNAKLLDLLKVVAPGTARVAVVRDPFVPAGSAGFAAIQTAASSLGVELTPIGVRDSDEIEHGITEFASRSLLSVRSSTPD
jgi:putative ABC transport system substrate-binding protein